MIGINVLISVNANILLEIDLITKFGEYPILLQLQHKHDHRVGGIHM